MIPDLQSSLVMDYLITKLIYNSLYWYIYLGSFNMALGM